MWSGCGWLFLTQPECSSVIFKIWTIGFQSPFFWTDIIRVFLSPSLSGSLCISWGLTMQQALCQMFYISYFSCPHSNSFKLALLFPFHSWGSHSSESVSHPKPLLRLQLLSDRKRIRTQVLPTMKMSRVGEGSIHLCLDYWGHLFGEKSHLLPH